MTRRSLLSRLPVLALVAPIVAACGAPASPTPAAKGKGGGGGGHQAGLSNLTVTAVQGTTITATTQNGQTKKVQVGAGAKVTRGGQAVGVDAIKPGDKLNVAGAPASDADKDTVDASSVEVLAP